MKNTYFAQIPESLDEDADHEKIKTSFIAYMNGLSREEFLDQITDLFSDSFMIDEHDQKNTCTAHLVKIWSRPCEKIIEADMRRIVSYAQRHHDHMILTFTDQIAKKEEIDDLAYLESLHHLFEELFDFRRMKTVTGKILNTEHLSDEDLLSCDDCNEYFRQLCLKHLNEYVPDLRDLDYERREMIGHKLNEATAHLSDRQMIADLPLFKTKREMIIDVLRDLGMTSQINPDKKKIDHERLNIIAPLGAYGMNNVRRAEFAFRIFEDMFEENSHYVAISSRSKRSVGLEELSVNGIDVSDIKTESDIFRFVIEDRKKQKMRKKTFILPDETVVYEIEEPHIVLLEMDESANTKRQMDALMTYADIIDAEKEKTIYLVSNSPYRFYTLLPLLRNSKNSGFAFSFCGIGTDLHKIDDPAAKYLQEVKVAISEMYRSIR